MTRELPPFLQAMLDERRRAGEGIHNWLFRVSRQLHAHLPAGEIIALLESRVANCGRAVSRKEIVEAVQASLLVAWQPTGQPAATRCAAKWPAINQQQRETIIADGGGLADLWELSRVRLHDNEPRTSEIIDHLFPGNPLLCCGRSSSDFDTKPREQWRGELDKLQLIVPSPMTAPTGLTKDGNKESAHTLDNTGPRRFLVVEQDAGTPDEQAAVLIHLAGYAPLVCAVHSGSKSLHGWFYVAGQPEDKVLKFFRYAVSIGGDPATWTRCQFVRMPDGLRDNGNRQTVFFLNYKALEAACERTH